ncbi:hypothetical protein BJ742DRAFT_749267 [Cladochytrium replicatum]|nr:hypothetical protein BJ742DRAFT_749267 [Cladochytrium replicatum]
MGCLVGASVTRVGRRVYAFAGFNMYTDDVYNDLYGLGVGEWEWRRVERTRGEAACKRNDHSATAWAGDKLVIFGGTDMNFNFLNDVVILELRTLTWVRPVVGGSIPVGRAKHSAVVHNDRLYIVGGCVERDCYTDELNILDLQTFVWLPPIHLEPRTLHSTFVYRNRLYVFGGVDPGLHRRVDLTYIDLSDYHVVRLTVSSDNTPPTSGQHFAELFGSKLVLAVSEPLHTMSSDEDHHNIDNEPKFTLGIWSLDLDSLRWRRHGPDDRVSRHTFHYACSTDPDSPSPTLLLFGSQSNEDEFLGTLLPIDLDQHGIVVVPPLTITSDFAPLLVEQNGNTLGAQLSDFTLTTSDPSAPPIRVHRLVLISRWPHFHSLLQSGMSESAHATLHIPEPHATVLAFVRFLYTDSLQGMDDATVADLMVLGHLYCLSRLQKWCVEKLHLVLGAGNAARVFWKAGECGEKGLRRRAAEVVGRRFGEVVRSAGFAELPGEVLRDLWEFVGEDAQIVGMRG